jgi:hypothetical protein
MQKCLSCCSCLTILALSNSHRLTAFQHRRRLLQCLPFERLCVHFPMKPSGWFSAAACPGANQRVPYPCQQILLAPVIGAGL